MLFWFSVAEPHRAAGGLANTAARGGLATEPQRNTMVHVFLTKKSGGTRGDRGVLRGTVLGVVSVLRRDHRVAYRLGLHQRFDDGLLQHSSYSHGAPDPGFQVESWVLSSDFAVRVLHPIGPHQRFDDGMFQHFSYSHGRPVSTFHL